MRKWLVGLLALACIGATTWAETATYTVASKTEVTLSGTAPDGATAVYEQTANNMGQATANNTLKLTLKGYDGTTITGLKLSMKSNASKGAGSLSVTCGDAIIAGIEDSKFNSENWNGAWSTEYVDITPAVTETSVDGDVVILISATENSLYCQSYTVEYTVGDPVFSVKFDKENWFTVAQGQPSSVTAIPQYGIEPYTFLWDSDTPELKGGTTDTLEIPATLAEGSYTVACLVTEDNGEGDAINALIGFTVEAVPVITGGSATYTVTGKSKVEASGDVPTGSTAEYSQTYGTAGQATKENSMTLTLKGYEGMTITGLTLSMKSNKSSGAGSLSVTCGDATIASIADSAFNVGWSDAYTQEYVDVKPEVTATPVDDDVVITIAATANSLYCQSYTVQFEAGEPGLSVTFDKADGFTVEEGTEDSITATAKNGVEPYEYAWTSDTPDLNGTGETLAIPATLAAGDYTVMVTVTDADSNVANKLIGFTVVAKYPITVSEGILNGSIAPDKGSAAEGEIVNVLVTPDPGFKFESLLVNDVQISETSFPMPAEAVELSATFVASQEVSYTKIGSADELAPGSYVITGAKAEGEEYAMMAQISDTSTAYILRRETALAPVDGVISTDDDSIVWELEQGTDGWTIRNEAVGFIGYVKGGNSAGAEAEATAKSSWTITSDEGVFSVDNVGTPERHLWYNNSSPRFACYTNPTLTTTYRALNFYKAGQATFSIKLDPASYFEVEVGEEASITATPKNAEGDVHYAWTVDGEPAGSDSAVLGLDTTAATEVIEVVCTATDGADTVATASVSYKVVLPAPKFEVGIAIGIPNGSVSADKTEAVEGEVVTLTAYPADGYKLEHFLVNDIAISANTFPMPAEDVLVSASFVEITGDQFTLVTSLDDLEDGAEYVITDNSQAYAMKAELSTSSTKRLLNEPVAPVEGVITTDEAAIVWKLVEDEDGNFAFYNDSIGKYIGWSSGNSAKFQDDAFANTISYEDELFVVMATSTADLEKPRKLQFNSAANALQFAYYEGSQKNLCFFKKSGEAAPKIVLSGGETTIELGESFDLNFELKNYDGDFEWVVDSREGGTIAQDGNYTWTPSETGEVTIKVVARNGELDIASKEVPLTVTEPGPQPGEPAIQFAVITDPCVVGQPVNFQVWAINLRDNTVYGNGFTGAEGSSLSDNDITYDFPDVSFVPDVAGVYKFDFIAGEQDEEISDSIEITVTDGPGPQPGVFQITGLSATGGNLVLTFAGEGTPAVLGTASLATPQEWTPVEGASVSGTTATVPMGAQNYIRLQ